MPEKSAPSKKHPALPLSEDQSVSSSSDDSDYEVDNCASLGSSLQGRIALLGLLQKSRSGLCLE